MAKKKDVKLEVVEELQDNKIVINDENINDNFNIEDFQFSDLKIKDRIALIDEIVQSENIIIEIENYSRYNKLAVIMVLDYKYIHNSINIELDKDSKVDVLDFCEMNIFKELKNKYLVNNSNYEDLKSIIFEELDREINRRNDSLTNIMFDVKNLSNQAQDALIMLQDVVTQDNLNELINVLKLLSNNVDKDSLQGILKIMQTFDKKDFQKMFNSIKTFIKR